MATITVKLDTNVGPFLGQPIAPEGWALWDSPANSAQNPVTGQYFRTADVVPDANSAPPTGTVTLIEPPNGWQTTPTGNILLALAVMQAVKPIVGPMPLIPATIPQGSKLAAPDPANPAFFTIAS